MQATTRSVFFVIFSLHVLAPQRVTSSTTVSVTPCSFGDVTKIDTTGASAQTAEQDKLKVTGVEALHASANADLKRMDKYKDIIMKVARDKQIDPAVIAAIISRESRAGAALKDGWGDNGYGFGLMQVDLRCYSPVGDWDSEEHIAQATDILIDDIKAIQKKFPKWTKEQQFKGGISAYNAGNPGKFQTYENMDVGTTGNDYDSDVVANLSNLAMF